MEIVNRIKTEIEGFNVKRKQLVAELQKEFPSLLKPLFEKYPEIEKISWHQYTPYFNDGDECVFGVWNDDDSIEINGVDFYDDSVYGKDEKKALYKEASEILQAVPEDFYKDLFGDHVEVTIKADSTIYVEEYGHD